jgi:hypothetical protein
MCYSEICMRWRGSGFRGRIWYYMSGRKKHYAQTPLLDSCQNLIQTLLSLFRNVESKYNSVIDMS